MEKSVQAPQQHKQPSRKSKRAWRKNVDVSDVQEGLETARGEVIKGGIIAEKSSNALFTLDITGSETIKKTYKLQKPLKADEILAQRSAVPAVDSRKRPGITDGVIEAGTKRLKGSGVSMREYQRLKSRVHGGGIVSKDVFKSDAVPQHDPWAEDGSKEQDTDFSYLEKLKSVRMPRTLKAGPVSLLRDGKSYPSVPKPKPGISYNPIFQDWDQMLIEEGQKEVESERKRLHLVAEEEEHSAKIAAAQDKKDDIDTEAESAWEGIESEYEGAEWLTKRRPERKTPVERNKMRRRKEAERQAKHDAEMKRRAQQVKEMENIVQEVAIRDTAKAVAALVEINNNSSSDEIDDRILRRRKLGKIALPERSLELVLPDELQDSLRLLKPEGNLLKDRWRTILVQGKMETRKPVGQMRKAKRTSTEKWTFKDFTVSA